MSKTRTALCIVGYATCWVTLSIIIADVIANGCTPPALADVGPDAGVVDADELSHEPAGYVDAFQLSEAIEVYTAKLAPQHRLSPEQRLEWAQRIIAADAEYDLGYPWVLAALVRRESAYWHSVDIGRKRGPNLEIGAVQVHPKAAWRRFRPHDCAGMRWEQLAARPSCSFRMGVKMFKYMFDRCPGTLWRKTASYKYGRCIPEHKAREDASAKNLRRFYCHIRPDCNKSWPLKRGKS
jgi:hypothetical protein